MDDYSVLGFLAAFWLVSVAVVLVYYVFVSLGLYRMAKSSDLENPWLAWLPFGNTYIMGAIVKEMDFIGQHITNLGIIYLVSPFIVAIASAILSLIPILGWLASFALSILLLVFSIMVLYKMFKCFVGEKAVLYTILTIIIPFGAPVCFMKAGSNPRLNDSTLS
ncbi:MAG TPA: hypothetical protein VHQ46_07235 [Desulfobacteria bacterium]|nr:hypothetical protein [Desulfobacteria bacterium]